MDLQFITHFTDRYSYYDSARMALEGGCRWIQLRMKDATLEEVRTEAVRVQALCKEYGATFIIDDQVELVKELHADGVHLGKRICPLLKHGRFWVRISLSEERQIPSKTCRCTIRQEPITSGAVRSVLQPPKESESDSRTGWVQFYRIANESCRHQPAHRSYRRYHIR